MLNKMGSSSSTPNTKLTFQCQQAQGSPTALVTGFSNVKELYQKISESYDGLPVEDILFCTTNTHRLDMNNLLTAQLTIEDFIFVHRKGVKKEVEVTKTKGNVLGITLTDNGTGYVFIKKIRQDSIVDKIKTIKLGDHIENIDSQNVVGWKHVDVAKYLRDMPEEKTFVMSLIEPLQAPLANK